MRTALVVGTLTLLIAGRSPAADPAPADLYRDTLRATARVVTPTKGKGTGWVVDRGRKLLVTNYHVVGDHETVDVIFPAYDGGRLVTERTYYTEGLDKLRKSGRAVAGRVLRKDKDRDLALVGLDALPDDVRALKLAPAKPLPGEELLSVGNRRDLDELWGCTAGAVRQTFRTDEGYFWQGRRLAKGAGVVLAQSPINEGDSGGPVVNARGELVGVAAAVRWRARLASLCIDADEVRAFVGDKAAAADKPAEPSGGAAVYRKALRSVALVKTASSNDRATAWVLDRGRKLLITSAAAAGTNDFVDVIFPVIKDGKPVAEAAYYRDNLPKLRDGGHARRGRVLARDADRNLALVEVESLPEGTAELALAGAAPEPGERLHALGNPNGVEALWAYAGGSVRQLGRTKLHSGEEAKEVRVVVAQLPLGDGDSGGPVLDDRGRLAGVASGKDAPQQLVSYVLDVREVKGFIDATRPTRAPRGADAGRARRAALYASLRLGGRAVADYDQALKLDPNEPRAGRAAARLLTGDTGGALDDCDAALKLDAKLVPALVTRAAAHGAKGDPNRAVADCDAALKLDPKSAAAYSTRGHAYRLKGDLTRALADFGEAVWLDPNLAPAYSGRGLTHFAKGDFTKAAADLTHATSLDPNDAATWRALAAALRKKGDEKGAAQAEARAKQAEEDTAAPQGKKWQGKK